MAETQGLCIRVSTVTCWTDAAELCLVHLHLHASDWTLQKGHCETSLSAFVFLTVSKFQVSKKYDMEKKHIVYGGGDGVESLFTIK